MEESNNAFLRIKDLAVEYTSGGQIIHAVNGVSLELKRGDTLGLVGETGAGKTTIAKAILRILQTPPAKIKSGEIWVDGQDLLRLPEHEMRRIRGDKISMIFQDPMTALNPVMSVGAQIAEAILLHNDVTNDEATKRAQDMLKMVGIRPERFVEYPHQFSGGMKQRVVIAMALACNPDLLLADEPTTALDVTIQAQILEMIGDLQRELNTAMILITHDLGVVAETCDNVAVVYAGQIVEYATKTELFTNSLHPYTRGLFDALPKMDDESVRLTPIEGRLPNPVHLPRGCKFHPRCKSASEECRKTEPELREVAPGHFCRCLKVGG